MTGTSDETLTASPGTEEAAAVPDRTDPRDGSVRTTDEQDPPVARPVGRRRWVRPAAVLVVLAVLGALAGLVWGSTHPVEFQGRSDVLIESNVSLTGDLQTFEVTERDIATQQAFVASPTVVGDASRLAGEDLSDAVSVSSAPDSNILTLQVLRPTRAGADEATDAYVQAYLGRVAARQRLQVDAQLQLATTSVQAATDALAGLDQTVALTPATQQPVVLSLQSAERTSLAQQQRDAQARLARLEDASARLPVNLQRVDDTPRLTPTGFSGATWVVLGAAAGLVVGVLLLARLAERRP